MKNPELSVIVLSHNTRKLLSDCLKSLEKRRNEANFEVIVPDNGSTDGSPEMVEKDFPWVKRVVKIGKNLGFAAGNNKARQFASGKYVLFLNSDTVVHKNTLKYTLTYLKKRRDVGALTCKIVLPNGELDKDTRRSFITPWIGLVHLYLRLDRIFPKSALFSKYWYGNISPEKTHEVDVIQGAFFMVRRSILDNVGWFDEDYFLDGEDIDLCWRIKEKGWKIIYYPKVKITHFKGSSKGKIESNMRKNIPRLLRLKHRIAGVESMEIFVRKRLSEKYPKAFIIFVIIGIRLFKTIRFIRTIIFG